MSTFGKISIGATTENRSDIEYVGTKFTPATSGTINQINAYIADTYGGGFNDFSVAIYSVTAGLPDVLLASVGGISLSNILSWQTIPITLAITAGTEYFLCVWGSLTYTLAYDIGALNQSFDKYFVSYNTWDSPFSGTNYNQYTREYSIYADYTTTAPPATQATIKGIQSIQGIQTLRF